MEKDLSPLSQLKESAKDYKEHLTYRISLFIPTAPAQMAVTCIFRCTIFDVQFVIGLGIAHKCVAKHREPCKDSQTFFFQLLFYSDDFSSRAS